MKITQRDLLLMKKLSSHGMMSTNLIRIHLFNSIDSATVLRRLRMLEKERLIKRILGLESQEHLWLLTIKGARLARVNLSKSNWNRNLLEHDLILVSVRLALEACQIAHSWKPEHEIRSLLFKKYGLRGIKEKLVPDGLVGVEINGRKESIAIELEMTLKSQDRIKKILRRYLEKAEIFAIWYVAPKKSILESVFNQWQLLGGQRSKIKFYVSLLPDLLSNPLEARLMGFKPTYSIKESWTRKVYASPAQGVSKQNQLKTGNENQTSESNHTPILESAS